MLLWQNVHLKMYMWSDNDSAKNGLECAGQIAPYPTVCSWQLIDVRITSELLWFAQPNLRHRCKSLQRRLPFRTPFHIVCPEWSFTSGSGSWRVFIFEEACRQINHCPSLHGAFALCLTRVTESPSLGTVIPPGFWLCTPNFCESPSPPPGPLWHFQTLGHHTCPDNYTVWSKSLPTGPFITVMHGY